MANVLCAWLLLAGLCAGDALRLPAVAQPLPTAGKAIAAPSDKKPAGEKDKSKAPPAGPTCTLLTRQGPRGGRLEVEGQGFGKAPLVRIGGQVTRMIERTETRIAVQIPRDSDGGRVSVNVGALEVECGTLTIIGKN